MGPRAGLHVVTKRKVIFVRTKTKKVSIAIPQIEHIILTSENCKS